ncbi:MAG TPA: type III-A CRISPR-associated RAMP protein Csm4 [Cyanobacteria bacterium UBA11372]|nr:type III-A CRISPR-associated RAMP protein Csm4 [Cyanobacteria bacterium UBA11372]
MCCKLVRLNFGRNFAHFGELGIGLEQTSERVRSDTLFSGWISAYAKLFGKQEAGKLLKGYEQHPELAFRLSSTFIYRRKGNRYTYYLPRPLVLPKGYPGSSEEDDLEFAKVYKKLNYLPLKIWHRWYQTDESFTEDDRDELISKAKARTEKEIDKGDLYHTGTFDYSKSFKFDLVPKIAVDRTNRGTNFYHTGFVKFHREPEKDEDAGLYFLVSFPHLFDQKLEHNLKISLELLGEEGIGGERSSGAGRFDTEWLDLDQLWTDILKPSNLINPHYCLISLYWEKSLPNGLLRESACYEIMARGGWIASPFSGRQLRRQSIRMFAEGSVFPILPQGELADVTPKEFKANHSIYRSGISVSLPINRSE